MHATTFSPRTAVTLLMLWGVLALAATPVDFSAKQPQVIKVGVQMICASTIPQPQAVMLKWVLDNQWVPAEGFTLYRKGPGDTTFTRLAGPIAENPNPGPLQMSAVNGTVKSVDIKAMSALARTNVAIPAAKQQLFQVRPKNISSSAAAFDDVRKLRAQQYLPASGSTPSFLRTIKVEDFPQLKTALDRFHPAPLAMGPAIKGIMPSVLPRVAPRSLTTTLTPADTATTIRSAVLPAGTAPLQRGMLLKTTPLETQVITARAQLMMGALLNAQVSAALGLGYTDAAVTTGQTYEYQLRAIKGGVDATAPSASCMITVGADPLPKAVPNVKAAQVDAKSVALRWDLDTTQSSARVIAYNVFRTVAGTRVQLNSLPLTIGPVQDGAGNYLDPIVYYTDRDAPVGKATYEVVGQDAFGRMTTPTVLEFTMADWWTPLPSAGTTCVVNGSLVLVYWQPSQLRPPPAGTVVNVLTSKQDTAARYNIYRLDTEVKVSAAQSTPAAPVGLINLMGGSVPSSGLSGSWAKVNSTPLEAAHIAPPVLPARNVRQPQGVALQKSSITFIDKAAKADHHYRYCVTALYPRNGLESAPSPSEDVPVADLTPPTAPGKLAGQTSPFTKPTDEFHFDTTWTQAHTVVSAVQPRVRTLSADPKMLNLSPGVVNPKPGAASVSKATIAPRLNEMLTAQPLAAATVLNSDLGCSVKLSWQAVELTAPVRYRIYRADASGFVPPAAPAAKATPAPAAAAAAPKPGARITPAMAMLTPPALLHAVNFSYVKRIDPSAMQASNYTLLAEVTTPAFTDLIAKSRMMYYNYRVTAVNRWGVEGAAATVQVRVPATIRPPVPQVAYAVPNADGGVTVTWKPLEAREETTKYLVYRKAVDVSAMVKDLKPLFLPRTGIGLAAFAAPAGASAFAAAAASAPGAAPTAAPVRAPSTLAAAPSALKIAPAALNDLASLKLRTLPNVPLESQEFRDALRVNLAQVDYLPVTEVAPDAIDDAGYVHFNDTKDLTPNNWYSYTVIAVDADTWRSFASKPLMSTVWKVKCASVTSLKAAADKTGRGIVLSWKAPGTDIVGYAVFRAQDATETYVQVSGTWTDTTFTDFGVLKGIPYHYRVVALDNLGNLSDPTTVDCTLAK
jgi:hypothetical protein